MRGSAEKPSKLFAVCACHCAARCRCWAPSTLPTPRVREGTWWKKNTKLSHTAFSQLHWIILISSKTRLDVLGRFQIGRKTEGRIPIHPAPSFLHYPHHTSVWVTMNEPIANTLIMKQCLSFSQVAFVFSSCLSSVPGSHPGHNVTLSRCGSSGSS